MANNANAAEMVSKAEHNQLKRKLEEAEIEIQKEKKKMKLMEALIAKGFQFPSKNGFYLIFCIFQQNGLAFA